VLAGIPASLSAQTDGLRMVYTQSV